VDGLRFRVPVQTIHAAPSPRFFGYQRGITWLNAVNDRFAGLGAITVTGTMRDSLYILDTLLNLDAGPKRIVTHWPDMLRVAGSLTTNQVRAYHLLRMLTRVGC